MSLTLQGVRKVFPPNLVVIEKIDLRIETGEFVAILGPSGCGKSTLLRMIAHLAEPSAGRIEMNAMDMPANAPNIAARGVYLRIVGPTNAPSRTRFRP